MKNSLNREIPAEFLNRKSVPYTGKAQKPRGRHYNPYYQNRIYKKGDKKLVRSLEDAITRVGLKDGMCISFHHHLRNGDGIVNLVMRAIANLGIKNLSIAPSALFPVHGEALIEHAKENVIKSIEGSMNGPLGKAVSTGEVGIEGVLRSHGGRTRAVQSGELIIDVAFIGAATSDKYGNLTGQKGPAAFGSLGYMLNVDELYANHIIAVTDNLVESPPDIISIPSARVDYVVEVDKIGDPSGIATGTLKIKTDQTTSKIVEGVLQVIEHSGLLKNRMSFQAGAGGISLAVTNGLKELMSDHEVHGSYIFGGVTGYAVDLLEQDFFDVILDGQSFDRKAIESLRNNPKHIEIPIETAYNPWSKGCYLNDMDFSILGATEVDIDFNVNVNTHSDGILYHGIGGHQDASNSRITIITVPLIRGRTRKFPIVIDKVTTVTTPGKNVAAVVTDVGITVNPEYPKLVKRLEKANIPLYTIEEIKDMALTEARKIEFETKDKFTTIVQWRDGTILDAIKEVKI